jgi:hypothetical protein
VTNFIPRLFCQGCSFVAFSRAVGTCSWADGLAIWVSPACAEEHIRRLARTAVRRRRVFDLE